jgi:hypothetical protein
MSDYNIEESIKAQDKLCKEQGYPQFAPKNGVCWNCSQNIYSQGKRVWRGNSDEQVSEGISTDAATKELVTGCPHCFRSYCD